MCINYNVSVHNGRLWTTTHFQRPTQKPKRGMTPRRRGSTCARGSWWSSRRVPSLECDLYEFHPALYPFSPRPTPRGEKPDFAAATGTTSARYGNSKGAQGINRGTSNCGDHCLRRARRRQISPCGSTSRGASSSPSWLPTPLWPKKVSSKSLLFVCRREILMRVLRLREQHRRPRRQFGCPGV